MKTIGATDRLTRLRARTTTQEDMMDFKGIKFDGALRYDRVRVVNSWTSDHESIAIGDYSSADQMSAWAEVTPATARKIAAELVKIADEAEGVKP